MKRAVPFSHLVRNSVTGIPPSVDCRAFVSLFDQTVGSGSLANISRFSSMMKGSGQKIPFHSSWQGR